MGRQLFLHHYLPAHLASALVTGALAEFILNVEPANGPDELIESTATTSKFDAPLKENQKKKNKGTSTPPVAGDRLSGQSMFAIWAAFGIVLAAMLFGWWFFLPLTYGRPGLSVEQVLRRKWLGYDLHFAK